MGIRKAQCEYIERMYEEWEPGGYHGGEHGHMQGMIRSCSTQNLNAYFIGYSLSVSYVPYTKYQHMQLRTIVH